MKARYKLTDRELTALLEAIEYRLDSNPDTANADIPGLVSARSTLYLEQQRRGVAVGLSS